MTERHDQSVSSSLDLTADVAIELPGIFFSFK